MAYWSQSAFLQALGWATINSFWQMGLLWLGFAGIQHVFRLSSSQKYNLALGGIGAGVIWFIGTFFLYYRQGADGSFLLSQHTLAPTTSTWNIILSSSSIAYLLLLTIPAYRLFKNWQYIEYIKKYGLKKAKFDNRLFVKRIAASLGIQKPVHLYLSELVSSPVTIGFLKPIILLPVAALNSLTPQQVEAVLLHELSHIRRYDYLVNLVITILHTLFYFNPFIKKFVSAIEAEREKCCDELVLQFEYDKISYASALLTLEKNAAATVVLAIAATGKRYLLNRIEKIVGQEKKPKFGFNHFTGLIASLLMVLVVNSLFFVNKQSGKDQNEAFGSAFENPFYAFSHEEIAVDAFSIPLKEGKRGDKSDPEIPVTPPVPVTPKDELDKLLIADIPAQLETEENPTFLNVAFDATDEMVTEEQKKQITSALEATKKVLTTTQWKEVEKSIADGMTAQEKAMAHQEYLMEMEKVNWKNLEKTLKTQYNQVDWNKIESNLNQALVTIQLDSLQLNYSLILNEIEQAEAIANSNSCATVLPDVSVKQLKIIKTDLRNRIDSIKTIRNRKVIAL